MKTVLFALAALMLFASDAGAATWTVDHQKSRLWFDGKWGGEVFTATFGKWDANIAFDPANLPASKASVAIELSSVASDDPDMTAGMKGPMGFAVNTFGHASFVTSSIRSAGGNNYVAVGDLKIHGIGKTIQLPFTLTIAGNGAHMTGAVTVSRIDFGLGVGSSMGMDWTSQNPVAHAITIRVDLTATKQ
jgi:polyisoprenoid-binding protein YceI